MVRSQLSGFQWALIQPLLPRERGSPGRPWNDHRQTVEGVAWIMRTGAPWRDLPPEFGRWQSVYGRFRRWCSDGTWLMITRTLLAELDERGAIDRDLWFIDSSCIRASRAAAGARNMHETEPPDHALGRSRGGFGTKLHLVCDSNATPLAVVLSAGQRHDSRSFEVTMQAVRIPGRRGPDRRRPRRLGADKAYSVDWIRKWLRRRGIRAVVPTRKDQKRRHTFDALAYRARNAIERCIGWLKEARRVATRYEKLASHFLGMILVAIISRLIRLIERDTRGCSTR